MTNSKFYMQFTSSPLLKFAAGIIGLLFACGGLGWYWWTTTPEYALSQIQKAYATHDVNLALKYIDIDAIFDNLWARFETKMNQQLASSNNGYAAFGALLGETMVQNMKPTLKENLRTQLLDSIKNGTIATSSVASLVAHHTITREADTVIVSSADTPLKLRMEKEDGIWRVVAVDGLTPNAGAADASQE